MARWNMHRKIQPLSWRRPPQTEDGGIVCHGCSLWGGVRSQPEAGLSAWNSNFRHPFPPSPTSNAFVLLLLVLDPFFSWFHLSEFRQVVGIFLFWCVVDCRAAEESLCSLRIGKVNCRWSRVSNSLNIQLVNKVGSWGVWLKVLKLFWVKVNEIMELCGYGSSSLELGSADYWMFLWTGNTVFEKSFFNSACVRMSWLCRSPS